MKQFFALVMALALLVPCGAAFAETDILYAWTAIDGTPFWQNTPLPSGMLLDVLDAAVAPDGRTWYQVVLPDMPDQYGWIPEDALLLPEDIADEGTDPAILSPDEVYAPTREEAYAIIKQRYQAGMDHYREMQEMDDEMLADAEGFAGNSPLYELYLDITGNGEPEMLFLATREGRDEWDQDTADLFVYTWKGDHAEQILWIDTLYAIAGNGPWYEIYQNAEFPESLYVRSGCDEPGIMRLYELNSSGQYYLLREISAYYDYESEEFFCYVNGTQVSEDDYKSALEALEVPSKKSIAWANLL